MSTEPDYEPLGVALDGVHRTDYHADVTDPIALYRCTTCGAIVGNGIYADSDLDRHSRWHASLAAVAASTD